MARQIISLFLAQLIIGFASCQYGSVQRALIVPTTTTPAPIDPCLPNPCFNLGKCVSSEDFSGFWCYCQDNTYGDLCENVVTTTTTTTMRPRVPVRPKQSAYQQPKFLDIPVPTTTRTTTTTTTTTMTPVDPCEPNPCKNMATCVSTEDLTGFWCYCLDNTYGDYCENVITTTTTTTTMRPRIPIRAKQPTYQQGTLFDLPTTTTRTTTTTTTTMAPVDPCEPNPCMNMGTCVSSEDMSGYWCYCTDNTYGDHCENVITTTTTTTTMKPRTPLRQFGYQQLSPKPVKLVQRPVQLMDIPTTTTTTTTTTKTPATSGCLENPCLNDGTCNDLSNGQVYCTCPWGYTGLQCEICLTECASNPCSGNKVCKARYGGGYDCVCPPSKTGLNCDIQNDICSTNPCINGGVCTAISSTDYTCKCLEGFAGANCEQIWSNPCTEDVLRSPYMMQFEFPWDNAYYIICADVDTWVQMPCSTGTIFNKKLEQCLPKTFVAPVCPAGTCLNDGDCLTDETGTKFTCTCKPGFTGVQCEIDIDECALNGNACGAGICIDQVNTYYCICKTGVGLDCKNTIEDPCETESVDESSTYFEIPSTGHDHFLQCTGLGAWTVHKCADGLFWNQEEKTCTMDAPKVKTGACTTFPCAFGICQDVGYNQYTCICKEGYTGPHCETMIDYCATNPCSNGGRCLPYAGGYTCVCQDKIIDECCCSGVLNPCSDKTRTYYPHLMPNRYIHCDAEGRAFVRTCPASTTWKQSVLSCLTEDFVLNITAPVILPVVTPVATSPRTAAAIKTPTFRDSAKPVAKPLTETKRPLIPSQVRFVAAPTPVVPVVETQKLMNRGQFVQTPSSY